MNTPCPVYVLPHEILILILTYLETTDLRSFIITCKRFHNCGKTDLVKRALTHCVRVNGDNLTVFQWCAKDMPNRKRLFIQLLHLGADWSARYRNWLTPLHLIASQGDADAVQRLIYAGCSPTVIDGDGNTALVYASLRNHHDVVKILLDSAKFSSQQTGKAICAAAKQGFVATVRLLCEYGGDVTSWDWFDQGPAICGAAAGGHEEVVQLLLDFGADPCSHGFNSCTVVHEAVASGNLALVQRLLPLSRRCLGAVDGNGRSPVQLAIRHGKADIAQVLVRHTEI